MLRRGMPARQIRLVLNGPLDSPRLTPGAEPLQLNHPAIITIAELADFKGVGDLIAAFTFVGKTLPLPYLYIVGQGPDRSKFERQARENGSAQRIVFCGSIPDPTPYLQSSDIFVLASPSGRFWTSFSGGL